MKCDELKQYEVFVSNPYNTGGSFREIAVLPADKVDEAIAELKAENERLKERIANGDVSRITWIDEVMELKEAQRWRKFSEEEPKVEEDYGEIFLVAVAVETEKKPKGWYVTSAEFCNGEWYNDATGNEIEENIEREDCFYRSKVTHWMPLPSAPKEDK